MSDVPHDSYQEEYPELTSDVRNWAMLCHLSALAGMLLPNVAMFVGPLLLWLLKGRTHPFIDDQAKEALNFQLSILIYSVLLCCTVIGIPVYFVLVVVNVVFVIIASIKAGEGEAYRYPFTLRLVK